jgi:hypothetical protein
MAEIRNRATLDSAQFQAGLQGMQGQVQGLARSMRGIPGIGSALSVAGLAALAVDAMRSADEIDNLATQMGMGVETVQAYQVALKEAGVSMGALQAASDRLKQKQAEAIQGNERARQSFRALGIDMGDLERADTTGLLELVGRGLHETGGDAEATSAQFELMGRNSERLKDVLIDLNKDGIQAQIQAFKELGIILDEFAIRQLNDAEQRLSRFQGRMGIGFKKASAQVVTELNIVEEQIKKMSALEIATGLLSPASFAGRLAGRQIAGEREEIQEEDRSQFDAAQEARDERIKKERENEDARRAKETQRELQQLEEKRRLQSLTNDELRAELNAKLDIARASFDAATGDAARLAALKEIHQLETDISRIREPRERAEGREQEAPVGQLRRIGANGGAPDLGRQQLNIQQRSLRVGESQWRVLQNIERLLSNDTQTGATF